jgi:hypothetical protein
MRVEPSAMGAQSMGERTTLRGRTSDGGLEDSKRHLAWSLRVNVRVCDILKVEFFKLISYIDLADFTQPLKLIRLYHQGAPPFQAWHRSVILC